MHIENKPYVFICNEVTWFFLGNVYLRGLMNRAIFVYIMVGKMWVNIFPHSFFFCFDSLLDVRKNKRVYSYDIILLLDVLFFLFYVCF